MLFTTGLREASWLVPQECEFVHLPNRDSLSRRLSRQWVRPPFLKEERRAQSLRPALLRAIVESFEPHALIVDYLPLGIDEELLELVFGLSSCRKYFISRGILGDPAKVRKEVLTPLALDALRTRFDRIIVLCDPR